MTPLQIRTAASHIPPLLTRWESFHRYLMIPVAASKVLLGLFTDTICFRLRSLTDVKRALSKHASSFRRLLSIRQIRSVQPSTGETISTECKNLDIHHDEIRLEVNGHPPATLHFIDCTWNEANNILLYFHGGAYIYPATPQHVTFALKAARASTSGLAMLEYTLTPESTYPSQLAQAVAALRVLLEYRTPSQIIVGGDSGGGNLTLGLLAHLRSPHPDIPPVDLTNTNNNLRAVFCISPRCSNTTTAQSFTTNASKDMLSADTVRMIAANWQPITEHVWATPLQGSREFWSDISANRVLLIVGAFECYLDDVREFAGLIGAEQEQHEEVEGGMEKDGMGVSRELIVCPGEYHVQFLADLACGIGDGVMLNRTLEWLRKV